jgi:plastocyanin
VTSLRFVGSSRLTRRQFLRRAALAALGVGLASALQECAPGTSEWTVEMNDQLKFIPAHLSLKIGDTVNWKNVGTIAHTVTADPTKAQDKANVNLPPGARPWDSGNIAGGKSWSRKFDVPGEYTYFCIPHETAGMMGRLTVAA